jgi:hopanoid-associated phosphorylase
VRPVLAVVGLKREAVVLRGLGVETIAGGGDPQRLARDLAERARQAAGIISFGMAGALDPALRIGDFVIGERVAGGAKCDTAWTQALAARLPQARIGLVHGENRLISEPWAKAALYATGAIAADMESDVAGEAATDAGIPFAILRCISDEAGAALPPAIAAAMRPGGGLAIGAVLGSIVRQPGQLRQLARTVRGFNAAYVRLRSGARTVGDRLAHPMTSDRSKQICLDITNHIGYTPARRPKG